jgi:multiple antibiotic resistance protein
MLGAALTSFTTFFATIGPIEAAVIFATLTPGVSPADRRRIAVRATAIASSILIVSTLAGGPLLKQLGVSIPALQTAGGIILLMIALDMVFAKPTSAFKLTPSEGAEAQRKDDLAVFPLATPLLAGPGAMSAGILMAANADGKALELVATLAALAAVMGLTFALLLVAHDLTRFLGVTAQRVLMRVFGILLAAIAVQAVFDGISGSGLIGPATAMLGR